MNNIDKNTHRLLIETIQKMYNLTLDQVIASEIYQQCIFAMNNGIIETVTCDFGIDDELTGSTFEIQRVTTAPTYIGNIKFNPLESDVFDFCLGHEINDYNYINAITKNKPAWMKNEKYVSKVKEQYSLMKRWLHQRNPIFLTCLRDQFDSYKAQNPNIP